MSHHRTNRAFYGSLLAMNVMVGVVFVLVSVPAPMPVLAAPIVVSKPFVRQVVIPATVGTPIRLVVPSLQLDLVVATGSYDAQVGDWTSSASKALYADISMPANDSNGTTLIYGHARLALFANLSTLQPGAVAEVYTDNNYVFRYTYASYKQVVPTDTSVFTSQGSPALVLQTCSGAWDVYRSLYSFELVSEDRS